MQQTLKLFKPLITSELEKQCLEDLAEAYQKDLNPQILATAFHKCYKLAISTAKKFHGLTSEDIESFAVTILDKCLRNYQPLGATFSTYYVTVYNNKLREETEALDTDKRKANITSNSLETLLDNGIDFASDESTETWMLIEILKSFKLSHRELNYCKLIMDGYTNADIASMWETSVMTLSNLRKGLRDKIDPSALQF